MIEIYELISQSSNSLMCVYIPIVVWKIIKIIDSVPSVVVIRRLVETSLSP